MSHLNTILIFIKLPASLKAFEDSGAVRNKHPLSQFQNKGKIFKYKPAGTGKHNISMNQFIRQFIFTIQ